MIDPNPVLQSIVIAFAIVLVVALIGGFLFLSHFVLTLPMRRAERARLFLDLIDTSLQEGKPVEQTLISVARSRDLSMGARFHLLTAWLEQNQPLMDALAKVPQFLPPRVTAMLAAGQKIGDLRKVLPACRQLLKDGVSHTRGAVNYLILLAFVITPVGIAFYSILTIFIIPKFLEVGEDMGVPIETGGIGFIIQHGAVLIGSGIFAMLFLWTMVIGYMIGPRLFVRFPALGKISFLLPWRRKRMQRDFSAMLAILLDSGAPESEAILLASRCAANVVFEQRAQRAAAELQRGRPLPEAVKSMDDSGEFGWRLKNALQGRKGFFQALRGWHESLDAKAFQEEQAAAQGLTTGLVLGAGLAVGFLVVSAFSMLVSIINAGVLW